MSCTGKLLCESPTGSRRPAAVLSAKSVDNACEHDEVGGRKETRSDDCGCDSVVTQRSTFCCIRTLVRVDILHEEGIKPVSAKARPETTRPSENLSDTACDHGGEEPPEAITGCLSNVNN